MGMTKKYLIAGLLLFFSVPVRAVDKDDFYSFIYGGQRFDRKAQAGLGIGFAPFNSLGFALLGDQTRTSNQILVESRWFVEPVEVAAAVGVFKNHAAGTDKTTRFAFMIEADYLFALSPQLAAKVIARPQFVFKSTSSFLAGLGLRYVF